MVLLARDIMDSQVLTVPGSSDALSCAQIMVARRKGYAVVQAPVGTAVGIVTEWDFLEKVLAAGRDPSRVLVADLASPIVRPCTPETPAEDVVAVMASEGIRRMIVTVGRPGGGDHHLARRARDVPPVRRQTLQRDRRVPLGPFAARLGAPGAVLSLSVRDRSQTTRPGRLPLPTA